jgi:hypothetical protein
MPLASLQCWQQNLSLSTVQVQLACAHFFGPDICSPPFAASFLARLANTEAYSRRKRKVNLPTLSPTAENTASP